MDALERTLQTTRRTLGDVDLAQLLDTTHPLLDGLQAFWLSLPRLVGGSKLYDLSSYGQHGNLTNMDPTNDWVHSDKHIAGAGLDFDGADDYVSMGNINPLGGAEAFTHEVVFLKPTTTSNFQSITRKGGVLNLQFRSGAFGGEQGKPGIAYFVNGGFRVYQVNQNLADNSVHHLSITLRNVDEQIPTAVVDGTEVSVSLIDRQISGTGVLDTSTQDFRIGASEDDSEYYDGQVFFYALRSKKLSLGQQKGLYEQWRRGFPDLLRRRDSVGLLGGGGGGTTIITTSLSDTTTFSGSTSNTASILESRGDTITISDLTSAFAAANTFLSANVALSDEITVGAGVFAESVTDAITFSSIETESATIPARSAETVTVTDSRSLSPILTASQSESLTFSTTQETLTTITEAVSDVLGLSENIGDIVVIDAQTGETLTFTSTTAFIVEVLTVPDSRKVVVFPESRVVVIT